MSDPSHRNRPRKTVTLITGANKGLGYETAHQLIGRGYAVYIGARDVERGQAAADSLGAAFVQLDVADEASVAAAMATIGKDGPTGTFSENDGPLQW